MIGMDAVSNLVPVEEYLHTAYRPDCDYVDGVLVERNLGQTTHQMAQQEILVYLRERRARWNIFVIQELRVQVSPTRYRVPDLGVVLGGKPDEEILTKPPFLCIEILSPEDRISRMQERIDDYFRFGVRYVWLVDPQSRRAWIYTPGTIQEVRDGVLRTADPELAAPLAEVLG
jgi:Uma2 family endonuclease